MRLSSRAKAARFGALMRFLAKWLMVLCVIAGLNSQAIAAYCSDPAACSHVADTCCQSGEEIDSCDATHAGQTHIGEPKDGHREGDDCRADDHHHHTCCSLGLVLGLDSHGDCKPGVPVSAFAGFRNQGDVPPEEPFLGSEKPPLI